MHTMTARTVTAAVAVGILVGCGPAESAEPTPSWAARSVAAAPAQWWGEPEPDPTTTPSSPPHGASIDITPGAGRDILWVEFNISDNLTKGMIKQGAQMATVDLLKWAHSAYPKNKVTVQGLFPMKDAYGDTANDMILNVSYEPETLAKINFDNIDADRIWAIRDSGMVHSELS